MLNRVFLSLGSNIGDRLLTLKAGILKIQELAGKVVSISSVYETLPWGNVQQMKFLNCAVELQTELDPKNLLQSIQGIESSFGRERLEKWGPRTLDIDIIFYENLILKEEGLVIPHPLLHERRFVLIPLHELAPEYKHPESGETISFLLAETQDTAAEKWYCKPLPDWIL